MMFGARLVGRGMAEVHTRRDQPSGTPERLRNTIDTTAVNRGYTIKQVAARARERLADSRPPVVGCPPDTAAATGLLVGTFLTMVVIPVVYFVPDSAAQRVSRLLASGSQTSGAGAPSDADTPGKVPTEKEGAA